MTDPDTMVAEAIAALRERREAEVLDAVAAAAAGHPRHALLWQALGMLHRALGDLAPALAALDHAAALAPGNAGIAHVRARAHLEAGLPALALFEAVAALAPDDPAVRLGKVSALLAERGSAAAIAALEAMLAAVLAERPADIALWGASDRADPGRPVRSGAGRGRARPRGGGRPCDVRRL